MKLRIKGPSLRLRLTRGEMQRLEEQGVVEERVPFAANASLIYRLRLDPAAHEIGAAFRDGVVEVRVPAGSARQWCASEQVTLAGEQPVPDGMLTITLEKDFACLSARPGEDETDNFPHPDAQRGQRC